MKKTLIFLMFITVISKFFGFGRELALSYFFGASHVSDAYIVSLTIPSVIFVFIVVAISTAYIPLYSKIEHESGEAIANEYTNNLINIVLFLTLVLFIICFVFARPIVWAFGSGFSDDTFDLAVSFTKISLAGMFLTGLISILVSFLQTKGSFIATALIGFPMNFITIAAIYFASRGNVYVLVVGGLLGTASELLILAPFAAKRGLRYRPVLNFRDENIKTMLKIAMPVIIGTSVSQIDAIIDRTIASNLAVGGISSLSYATKLSGFVFGLTASSITAIIYPAISKMSAAEETDAFKALIIRGINMLNLLIVPSVFGLMIFAAPIVRMLFGRGAFDANAIGMTSGALFFYAPSLIFIVGSDLLYKAFFSMQDTKTPMFLGFFGVAANITLNIVLSSLMGINGLALATSVASFIGIILAFLALRKKIGPFGLKSAGISFLKILASSAIMGCCSLILYRGLIALMMHPHVALLTTIFVAALLYFLAIAFMKVPEFDSLLNPVKAKFKSFFQAQ